LIRLALARCVYKHLAGRLTGLMTLLVIFTALMAVYSESAGETER